MNKLFWYEIRRTVCSRSFSGLLAVLLWLAWQLLRTETILGVAHTAPFSSWSFGSFLARLTPLMCLGLLFFLRNLSGSAAAQLSALTDATPMPPNQLLRIRAGAAAVCALLPVLGCIALGFWFLWSLFGADVPTAELLFPALLTLAPALLLTLGLGLLARRLHPALLPVAAVGMLALELLPGAASLSGAAFYTGFPLTLDILDPAFSIPAAALAFRLIYVAVGVILTGGAIRTKRQPHQK